jgi:hypothetical protein
MKEILEFVGSTWCVISWLVVALCFMGYDGIVDKVSDFFKGKG